MIYIVIVLLSLSHISTTSHQQESSIADKPKEEIRKVDLSSASSYMITNKQDNDKNNNNISPFAAGTAAWQSLMTYWLYTYGEFNKNSEND